MINKILIILWVIYIIILIFGTFKFIYLFENTDKIKKNEFMLTPNCFLYFMIFTVFLFCTTAAIGQQQMYDLNEKETGLRIDYRERECYDFCDGGKYYYVPTDIRARGKDRPGVCECK